ncbi:arylsulfatase [Haloferula chungangensis]|uniref:Arylsulfatase n=2 Tax=Haloferula chungangensis TaxID=1048331 RepID=A0ABW2L107_9BACT
MPIVCVVGVLMGQGLSAKLPEKPNVVVILVDDMGFSDIGCFGGEIPTPNIDALAAGGLRFTRFYNAGRCSPSRASLLTGLYSNQAGVGRLVKDQKLPGYRGGLNDRCVTLAEVLAPAGYLTAITGKWHVGGEDGLEPGPWMRGFERGLNAPTGGFYFGSAKGLKLYLNGEEIDGKDHRLPKNWYATDLWTEYGLKFVDEAISEKKPFFLYQANCGPHFPLQAPAEDIAAFRGKYRMGWDELRKKRYAKQKELGVIGENWELSARPKEVPAWDSLSEEKRDQLDHVMAVYAAVMTRLDKSVGDLVAGLKQRGVLNNTLILFMSDNGGSGESGAKGAFKGDPTKANSRWLSGAGWAYAQDTPFFLHKRFNHEGGIATPLIVYWPDGIDTKGELRKQTGHLIDLMPTLVDVCGATYPKDFKGHAVQPMEGVSLVPALSNKSLDRNEIYWEHQGNAALRSGNLKLVRKLKTGKWELYDIETDGTETHNLASEQPEKVEVLTKKWQAWAERANVLPAP